MTIEKTDVLVIGAGPAGLLAGVALGSYDVSTIIIDRRELNEIYGHADGIQPGTLEMWQSYGLRGKLMDEGCPLIAYGTWSTNPDTGGIEREKQTANISTTDARYPYEVTVSIETMERILRDAASKHRRVSIQQPFVPTCVELFEDDGSEYPVTVTLTRPNLGSDGCSYERKIQAKYVIGCDGARSWVRRSVGITMEKAENEDEVITWGVLDFTPVGDFPDVRIKTIVSSPVCGMIGWIPRPHGTARIYVPLSPGHETYKEKELLDVIQNIVSQVLRPYTVKITDCTWVSTYRVVQQVATAYSVKNRIFIAGDACHTHSPKAGQGANASMRDTHNLAWKLAYVLRGWAKPSLLSTYEVEQRAFAQELIALDYDIARAFKMGGNDSKYARIWNNKNRFLTGIGILHHSALTPVTTPSTSAPNLVPGERMAPAGILRLSDWTPLDVQDLLISDCTFKLLLFVGDITDPVMRANAQAFDIIGRAKTSLKTDKIVQVHTIFNNRKSDVHWTDAPDHLRDPERVYVDDKLTSDLYCHGERPNAYTFYSIGKEGVAVLVRPDAHISLVVPVDSTGADMVNEFLSQL